jgi:hypothetical protein
MAEFKDSGGLSWSIGFVIGHLEPLRVEAGWSINRATSGDRLAESLFAEPETLAAVLWVFCRDQAAARNLDRTAFYGRLDEVTLTAATDALLEAIIDFFHPRQKRALRAKLPQILAKMDAELNQQTSTVMSEILNRPAGSLPASAESTPVT